MRNLLSTEPIDFATVRLAIADTEPLGIGEPASIELLAHLASRLLAPAVSRRYPELASLGFFLRRSELKRLAETARIAPPDVIRVPRGLHFHIPPANVDTVFVYSWALSLICGNPNIVRVSPRTAGAATVVLEILGELLDGATPSLQATQWFVAMDHDDPAFPAISAACAQRVIWGGDRAVAAVRQHPLGPRSVELPFPDRSSLCIIAADRVSTTADTDLGALVQGFANDVWWFDQAACSSPRTIVWLGSAEVVQAARHRFFAALDDHLERNNLGADPSMAMQRRVALYGLALEQPGAHLDFEHARYSLAIASRHDVGWLGAGGFVEYSITSLDELRQYLDERDQTLTYFGLERADLVDIVTKLGGRAIDRVVPIGQALQFGRFWDGFDLLVEMTRTVVIAADKSHASQTKE